MRNDIAITPELKSRIERISQTLRPSTIGEVARQHYVLEAHAQGLLAACKKHKICVTIRNTGEYSLQRIREGHPCKGHNILDKSIKQKSGVWTYYHHGLSVPNFKGLVGSPQSKVGKTTTASNGNKVKQYELGGLHFYDRKNNKDVVLKVSGEKPRKPSDFYTGDYDMHDLLYGPKGGGRIQGSRMVVDSAEEKKYIQVLNKAVNGSDDTRNGLVSSAPGTSTENPFSVFRHGPQGTYYAFAKSHGENVIQGLTVLAPPIAAFLWTGEVYILNNAEEILAFYFKINSKLISKSPKYRIYE